VRWLSDSYSTIILFTPRCKVPKLNLKHKWSDLEDLDDEEFDQDEIERLRQEKKRRPPKEKEREQ